ncbi:unnamed protein product [Clavelina lepadiformis]|uniref:Phosphate transporter n=1 Tax=Clavelina lepadiformis TaxID=159417 RepID=A0ABP0FBF0_CLALP
MRYKANVGLSWLLFLKLRTVLQDLSMETSSTFDVSSLAYEGTTAVPWSNEDVVWIIVVGFIVAFVLSFAVGANDVANSFGTTVGAKVLTLKQACILATIFETTGAVLLGAKVGETIRKGIIDVTMYNDIENGVTILMLGNLSAMFGSAVWQLIATVFKLPVSGTHSIVGACVGFSLVAIGLQGVNWTKLGLIVASWFLSPVLSGSASVALYLLITHVVLKKTDPVPNGLLLLPFFYALTIGINVFSILYAGAPLIGLDHLLLWQIIVIALGVMLLTGLLVHFIAVPRIRRKISALPAEQKMAEIKVNEDSTSDKFMTHCDSGYDTPYDKNNMVTQKTFSTTLMEKVDSLLSDEEEASSSSSKIVTNVEFKVERTNGQMKTTDLRTLKQKEEKDEKEEKLLESGSTDDEDEEDPPVVTELFSFLQIMTACFASFAHGGNDVSNAIGPLIALWIVFQSGEVAQKAFTPWYLLVYGGVGISAGLWVLGRRVIQTIGSDLTRVTPSRGFCVELMTAITVLVASNIGLPVSTTHCKVGAVVSIGWLRSRTAVDWRLVGNIGIAWFVTVPVSGLLSAGAMWILMQAAL